MIQRVKRGVKWLVVLLLLGLMVFASLAIYTNVDTGVTAEDRQVFESLGLVRPQASLTFEQEVALIRRVQAEVFKRAPMGVGIPDYQTREPLDLIRAGHGLCYDRSRTFDKAFSYLGFESRHVYLLFRENRSFFWALFHYGQSSHAVTEVKTSRGWLFVDSNMPWVAVTRTGEPVGADDVWRRFGEFENAPPYLDHPWWPIRGMYSRKGHFYAPYVIFPEFNWQDFGGWVVGG